MLVERVMRFAAEKHGKMGWNAADEGSEGE